MAEYFTLQNLIGRIGDRVCLQCLDDLGLGSVDDEIFAEVRRNVTSLMNGYISRQYSIETVAANPPDTVIMIGTSIGCHFTYQRRPEFIVDGKTPASGMYDEAMRLLKEIGAGTFRLDVDGVPAVPANVSAKARTGTYLNAVPVGEGFVKDGTGCGGF